MQALRLLGSRICEERTPPEELHLTARSSEGINSRREHHLIRSQQNCRCGSPASLYNTVFCAFERVVANSALPPTVCTCARALGLYELAPSVPDITSLARMKHALLSPLRFLPLDPFQLSLSTVLVCGQTFRWRRGRATAATLPKGTSSEQREQLHEWSYGHRDRTIVLRQDGWSCL